MAVRLRPQSSAWLAPTALAAQLTAQTGAIKGSGVASLLGGIAQGVNAFSQKREQRRVEGINETRYQDSLRMRQADDARQDRAFMYGAAQDQAALNKDFLEGAKLAYALDPTPENLRKVQQGESNAKALAANMAKYGGVQLPDLPDVQRGVPAAAPQGAVTPTAATEPTGAGSYSREDARRLAISMRDMSDEEVAFVSDQYAQEALTRKATLDRAGKAGIGPTKTQSEYDEYSLLASIAKREVERRKAKAESAQKVADLNAQATKEIDVHKAKKKIDTEADAAELPALQADAALLGAPAGLKTKKGVEAGMALAKQDDAQAESRPFRDRALKVREDALALQKRELDLREAGKNVKNNSDKWKMVNSLQEDAAIHARSYRQAEADAALARVEILRAEIQKDIDAAESGGSAESAFASEAEARAAFDADPMSKKYPVGSPERKALADKYKARVRR